MLDAIDLLLLKASIKHSYFGLPFCRHFLVIPKEHIPTVRNLQRRAEDYSLGNVTIVKCNSFMVFCLTKGTGGGNGWGNKSLKSKRYSCMI